MAMMSMEQCFLQLLPCSKTVVLLKLLQVLQLMVECVDPMDTIKQLLLLTSRLPNHIKGFGQTCSEGTVIGKGMLLDISSIIIGADRDPEQHFENSKLLVTPNFDDYNLSQLESWKMLSAHIKELMLKLRHEMAI